MIFNLFVEMISTKIEKMELFLSDKTFSSQGDKTLVNHIHISLSRRCMHSVVSIKTGETLARRLKIIFILNSLLEEDVEEWIRIKSIGIILKHK